MPGKKERHAQQRRQSFAPGHRDILIAAGDLHVLDLQWLFSPHDDAVQTFLDADSGRLKIGVAGAETGAQLQPFASLVEQHQGAHLGAHQHAAFAGDDLQRVIQIEGGAERLADAGQRLEQAGFEAELLVKPGIVNYLGGLAGQRLQQFLVLDLERVTLV